MKISEDTYDLTDFYQELKKQVPHIKFIFEYKKSHPIEILVHERYILKIVKYYNQVFEKPVPTSIELTLGNYLYAHEVANLISQIKKHLN